jgi:hypothetical protein
MLRPTDGRWRWAAAAIVADAAIVVALAWWLFPSIWAVGVAVVDIDQSAGPEVGVNLREVAKNPGVMWGRTVTVSAAVDRLYGPHAVLIGNDAPFVGVKVLVVGASPLDGLLTEPARGPLTERDVIRVTGVVEPFDIAALESELAVELPVPSGAYDGTSVLVATEIELDPPKHAGPGDKEFPSGSNWYEIGITANDIVTSPEDQIGEVVQLSDEIDEPALDHFSLVLGDQQLLVVTAEPNPDVFVEATAFVTGEVRLFDLKALETELGIDLNDALLTPFEGEPVVVAQTIDVVA